MELSKEQTQLLLEVEAMQRLLAVGGLDAAGQGLTERGWIFLNLLNLGGVTAMFSDRRRPDPAQQLMEGKWKVECFDFGVDGAGIWWRSSFLSTSQKVAHDVENSATVLPQSQLATWWGHLEKQPNQKTNIQILALELAERFHGSFSQSPQKFNNKRQLRFKSCTKRPAAHLENGLVLKSSKVCVFGW